MQARQLLLKLRICRGINFRGEYRVYQWLKQNLKVVSGKQDLDLDEQALIEIAQIKRSCQAQFRASFLSDQLESDIALNERMCNYTTIFDEDYPPNLLEAGLPPMVLFYQGNIRLAHQKLLGMVGSRKNSGYAIQTMRALVPELVKNQIVTVSGLATGVDGLCHRLTIQNGGSTIAVIGTGLDYCYPRNNVRLQSLIAHDHLLLTEYPLGVSVRKHHFLERNRVIAGLIKNIIIIEAAQKSGSLITANLALNNNRNVMAIPGPIGHCLSVGCNELIAEGAKPVLTVEDILEDF
ncbi:DNA-processing protein DprA [Nicoliella spurrieriana]|uniref:DNA-processing protein DprA n=1 Tax=Nicoliella spurrieriana TaxID=2925830 RepID=A0A976RRT3_9LACO|nr:DNA-processing protein DprA [Nicoliella spurrieriana]UQS86575.1 DNA-processing protein DprA [Nicoliella spurrieriana]